MSMEEAKQNYSLFRFIEIPDFVTMAGIACAILAMQQAVVRNFYFSFFLLFAAVFFDYFDGKVARFLGKGNRTFGEVLDSLGDTVSFLVAPMAVGYLMGFNHPIEVAILIIFVLTGIARLARFSCIKHLNHHTIGMPVTYNGLLFPLIFSLMLLMNLEMHSVLSISYLFAAFMMGSTIALPEL